MAAVKIGGECGRSTAFAILGTTWLALVDNREGEEMSIPTKCCYLQFEEDAGDGAIFSQSESQRMQDLSKIDA